ncbi:hypothetical protein ACOSQ2_008292 [Xanthoceras sorbifolium]
MGPELDFQVSSNSSSSPAWTMSTQRAVSSTTGRVEGQQVSHPIDGRCRPPCRPSSTALAFFKSLVAEIITSTSWPDAIGLVDLLRVKLESTREILGFCCSMLFHLSGLLWSINGEDLGLTANVGELVVMRAGMNLATITAHELELVVLGFC